MCREEDLVASIHPVFYDFLNGTTIRVACHAGWLLAREFLSGTNQLLSGHVYTLGQSFGYCNLGDSNLDTAIWGTVICRQSFKDSNLVTVIWIQQFGGQSFG